MLGMICTSLVGKADRTIYIFAPSIYLPLLQFAVLLLAQLGWQALCLFLNSADTSKKGCENNYDLRARHMARDKWRTEMNKGQMYSTIRIGS